MPPPSVENISNVTLRVAVYPHLSLQLLISSNDSCVHLLCSMEDLTTELVNFTWSQEGQRSLLQFTSNGMNSELRLCNPDWSEGDTITCYARYSGTQTQRSIHLPANNASEKGQTETHLPVCVVLFGIFIISIVFILILFFIFKYKNVTSCNGPST
ncbi:hypothetical protein QQF64_002231 [Cirrhinus molitorella]|uniref:Ig-like domain-containing protein n=1 Tax=Cirrhinus molitorella TaxID=172907 RepID=A0ABR3MPK8_9TELE